LPKNKENKMSNEEILLSIFPEKYGPRPKRNVYVLACDASFSKAKSRAGLCVFDHTSKQPIYDIVRATDSTNAEFKAIQMAASYALECGYKSVRIVHDCQSNQERARLFAISQSDSFDWLQIVWRGRDAVRAAHCVAKQAMKDKRTRI
jgi:ribonuclease HI